MAALGQLGAALRTLNYDNTPAGGPLARLALGVGVPPSAVAGVLPTPSLDSLRSVGALAERDGFVALRFRIFAAGRIFTVVPLVDDPEDEVYIGRDSMWLLETVWRRAPGGGTAVELGTGTGFLAAVLTSRYRLVVGTELMPHAAAFAAVTLALNPQGRAEHRAAICVADVAAGLRPGAFDLVAANPPYLPHPPAASGRSSSVYASGGPTGFELPRRFLDGGLSLLRPDGVLITVLLDAVLADGRRPCQAYVDSLRGAGFEVDVLPVPAGRLAASWEPSLLAAFPVVAQARLVSLVITAGDA